VGEVAGGGGDIGFGGGDTDVDGGVIEPLLFMAVVFGVGGGAPGGKGGAGRDGGGALAAPSAPITEYRRLWCVV
jgi:hypothetical protein